MSLACPEDGWVKFVFFGVPAIYFLNKTYFDLKMAFEDNQNTAMDIIGIIWHFIFLLMVIAWLYVGMYQVCR